MGIFYLLSLMLQYTDKRSNDEKAPRQTNGFWWNLQRNHRPVFSDVIGLPLTVYFASFWSTTIHPSVVCLTFFIVGGE